MIGAPPPARGGRGRKAIRFIVIINFLLVIAWFGPLNNARIYQALRRAGVADMEVLIEQLWIAGSTLFATALFLWDIFRRPRRAAVPERATKDLALDGALLLAWWATLIIICAYAFMLGMAA